MDSQVSKPAEQVADAVSGTGNETGPVAALLNSLKVIDRSQRYMECRSDLLTAYMYELVKLRVSSQTASAASPVAGVSGLDAEISEAKKEFIATFDAYRKAQKAWRHLVKRMYYECGATKADEFIRRVESGEHDVPSPWLAQPSAEGDGAYDAFLTGEVLYHENRLTVTNGRIGLYWHDDAGHAHKLGDYITPEQEAVFRERMAKGWKPRKVAEGDGWIADGVSLIAAERRRQVESEGWTPAHDDKHRSGELVRAGLSYGDVARKQILGGNPNLCRCLSDFWPSGSWGSSYWKPVDRRDDLSEPADPKDTIRNLVKAGALIAAEIDRLKRLPTPPSVQEEKGSSV